MTALVTADHVLVHDGRSHRLLRGGAVGVDGFRIVYVGSQARAPRGWDDRIDLGQALLMPGLIDLNALADIDHLQLDAWCDAQTARRLVWSEEYFATRRRDVLTPDDRRTMRMFAVAQLALHGITTVMPIASEAHSAWAETHDDLLDVARCVQQVGLRAFLGPSYRSGVHVTRQDGTSTIAEDLERGRAGLADAVRFLDTVDALGDARLAGVLLPCRLETVHPDILRRTAQISAARGTLVRIHALQDVAERSYFRERHGMSPVDLLDAVGLLTDRTLVAHAVYVDLHRDVHGEDRGELARLAATGVAVVHCPLTSARYAFVPPDLQRYLDAGVTVALGTDSFPPDLIRGIDAGVSTAKQQHDDLSQGMLADYVNAATVGGARALHRPDLGRIAVGATADLTGFTLDDPRMGPVDDPLRTLVLAGSGRDTVFTMVHGRAVVRDGTLPGLDLPALRRDAQRIFDTLRAAYPSRDHRRGTTADLFPPVFADAPGAA